MITDKDVKKLKNTFATKEDLDKFKKVFVSKDEFNNFKKEVKYSFGQVDKSLGSLVEDVKIVINMVGEVSQKLDDHRKETNDILDDHERRLDKVEDKIFSTS